VRGASSESTPEESAASITGRLATARLAPVVQTCGQSNWPQASTLLGIAHGSSP
jgi:hypothetical protein